MIFDGKRYECITLYVVLEVGKKITICDNRIAVAK
jgi:hypothetical protein